MARGRLAQAAERFASAIALDPRDASIWHDWGTAQRRLGDTQAAFEAYRRALTLDPTQARTWLNLGNLLVDAGQRDDATECYERAARHDPALAAARRHLAQERSARGQVEPAEALFRQSLDLDPEQVEAWFGLGRTLEDLGQAEGAIGCYRQAIARRPTHAAAIGHLLALEKDALDPAVLDAAESLLEDPEVPDEARALVGYGLAKNHDRRKDLASAAHAARRANRARRRSAGPLDREALARRVDDIVATYTRDFFAARGGYGLGTDQPVFIVGLPRSGTTLTEQILSTHPLLHGAGELPDLARIALGCTAGDGLWSAATALDELSSRERASEYLRALRNGAPRGRLRISDKSPLNFFQLAFAALLFPNARVIHCRREPRDVALSIWMENFRAEQRHATDFGDLAFYAGQYRRLMDHWRIHLPLRMLELDYEETVADLEGRSRQLIDFLGAPWDARCLDFHRQARAVQTPSRWQVRQPIYTASVARWKRYAPHLPELEDAFGPEQR